MCQMPSLMSPCVTSSAFLGQHDPWEEEATEHGDLLPRMGWGVLKASMQRNLNASPLHTIP